MRPRLIPTSIPDLFVLEIDCFVDERGFFLESYHRRDFAAAGITLEFVQDSHSQSRQGVLRGFHYQDARAPLAKLIRCTAGAVFDVAVDIRAGSPTFGRWFGTELTAANRRQMLVPVGFAHGFVTLSEVAEVQYRQTGYYTPEAEGTLAWNDPGLAVAWPIPDPVLSGRDRAGRSFAAYRQAPAFVWPGKPRPG